MTENEHAGRIKAAAQALNEAIKAARDEGLRVDVAVDRGPGIFGFHEDPNEPKDIVSVRAYRRL